MNRIFTFSFLAVIEEQIEPGIKNILNNKIPKHSHRFCMKISLMW
jgi:hypothetical protein